jgi:hypothetical protein
MQVTNEMINTICWCSIVIHDLADRQSDEKKKADLTNHWENLKKIRTLLIKYKTQGVLETMFRSESLN